MQQYSITKLIGIPKYKITAILSDNAEEIHIRVEPYKRKPFVCSGCGEVHKKGYHGSEESIVEDVSACSKRTYLHVVKRRHVCPRDNCIYIEHVAWLRKHARVTKRFAAQVSRLTAITTNQEAGWFFNLDDERIYRIDKENLEEQYKKKLIPPPAAVMMSVDEVSYRKYHRYLTNVVDIEEKAVIWNDKGRKTEVLDQYYKKIGSQACEAIKSVALDGARTYIGSTNKYAINATIVYDKFHIRQKLNWAVDMTRKYELRKARKEGNNELIELTNCKRRFILLKNKNNLTESQNNSLKKLCNINEPIYKAMLLKESFLKIYEYQSPENAKEYLKHWLEEAQKSTVEMFRLIAVSFKDKFDYIINWFKIKISSAISEGINNKIKRLKRMAYGYRDIEYFKLKIHQHCGLLNPRRYPQ